MKEASKSEKKSFDVQCSKCGTFFQVTEDLLLEGDVPVDDELVKVTASYLPQGDMLYPTDIVSDSTENFRIAEIIREKILICTEQEVPHASAVIIESKKFTKKGCEIQAMILVEKSGQKGILIGKGGSMLKRIGSMARTDIEKLLGTHVYLSLFVRVEDDWRSKDARISEFGYGGAFRE